MNCVKISVLMSVYNGEKWLAEAIESVLEQTLNNFEFIIINDGSTDFSENIINSYQKKDPRIRAYHKSNTGLADSLNFGIRKSQGEWIARIDADDVCEPDRLEVQYAMACLQPDIVLLGSGLVEIAGNGKKIKEYNYPKGHHQLVKRLLQKKGFFPHSSAFIRVDALTAVGGYRARIRRAQDFDLWLRLSELGKIACSDEPLVQIRHHPQQISHDEGGARQIIDSRVALVSYHLRQGGLIDPVNIACSDEYFTNFWYFVETGIKTEKLIELRNFINRIKLNLENGNNSNIFATFLIVLSSPVVTLYYLRYYLFGETFSKRYMKKWKNHTLNRTNF